MNDEGVAHYGTQPDFLVINHLHQQVHALALDLLVLHAQGENSEALARLKELHEMRDNLLEKLQRAVNQRAVSTI